MAGDEDSGADQRAQAWFDQGYNCAQAVLLAFTDQAGLDPDQAKKLASVFGGGMARLQLSCGALTGAFMAMGSLRGFNDPQDAACRERLIAASRELAAQFKAEFGSLECRDLLGLDLMTPEGQRQHKETGQRASVCSPCVRFAASRLEALLS